MAAKHLALNKEMMLREMIAEARRHHKDETVVKLVVLTAWATLTSGVRWTSSMVTAVEKALAAALIAVAIARSGRAATTICETKVQGPSGKLATGTITLTVTAAFSTPGGARVEQVPVTVQIRNGAFCAALEPNDTGAPAKTSYKAHYQLDGAAPRDEYWLVPTSGTTLGVKDVAASRVAPDLTVLLAQLNVTGVTDGSYCLLVAGGVVTGLTTCTGGGGHVLFDSATGLFDSAGGLFDDH